MVDWPAKAANVCQYYSPSVRNRASPGSCPTTSTLTILLVQGTQIKQNTEVQTESKNSPGNSSASYDKKKKKDGKIATQHFKPKIYCCK